MMLSNAQSQSFTPEPASFAEFGAGLARAVQAGARVVACFRTRAFAQPLWLAVLGRDESGKVEIFTGDGAGNLHNLLDAVPSLAPFVSNDAGEPGSPERRHAFASPALTSTHEVAVGPVHAGIIEPGHFRFQCAGETILSLRILLGYQHRGAEALVLQATPAQRLALVQEVSGDATIAHTLAYCQAIEALSDTRVSIRAQAIRAVALELERIANHVGDTGALAGDVGYQPTAALCGRLRGAVLNITALLCGNRFGRWLLAPGGVSKDATSQNAADMLIRLRDAMSQFLPATARFLETPGVLHRFEGTGRVSFETAKRLGLVGPAARACGLARDVRQDYPSGYYAMQQIPVANASDGDVYARALVRRIEVLRAGDFLAEVLASLPEGPALRQPASLKPTAITVSLVEGWRGEVAHVALTDARGQLADYRMVDPSRHNWAAVSAAMRGQQISDFPLCNKSFNLSYAGHDL